MSTTVANAKTPKKVEPITRGQAKMFQLALAKGNFDPSDSRQLHIVRILTSVLKENIGNKFDQSKFIKEISSGELLTRLKDIEATNKSLFRVEQFVLALRNFDRNLASSFTSFYIPDKQSGEYSFEFAGITGSGSTFNRAPFSNTHLNGHEQYRTLNEFLSRLLEVTGKKNTTIAVGNYRSYASVRDKAALEAKKWAKAASKADLESLVTFKEAVEFAEKFIVEKKSMFCNLTEED